MKKPNFNEELALWRMGHRVVVGIDEVGRGAFAGPVVAAAVAFSPFDTAIDGINDSKMLRPKLRKKLSNKVRSFALCYSIAEITVGVINKYGIGRATEMAFRRAVKLLRLKPDYILMDGFYIRHLNRKSQKAIKNGDQKSISIAAASIIAKVYRDTLMKRLHKQYPHYLLSKNKGYGTKQHREALRQYGLSRLHRTSFNLARFLS